MSLHDPAEVFDRSVLTAPGGFVWWYIDAVDADGNGLVMIWSFGLPFLPGYLDSARRGNPATPGMRPSLNLMTFRAGETDVFHLEEFDPAAAEWVQGDGQETWRFGDTSIDLKSEAGRVYLEAELDCAVPGSKDRLRGTVKAEGAATRFAPEAAAGFDDSHHGWNPVAGPVHTEAILDFGARPVLRLQDLGYLDRNLGFVPFDRLGIDHWIWGRWVEADRTRVFFSLFVDDPDAEPQAWLVEVEAGGRMTVDGHAVCRLERGRSGAFGMPYWDEIEMQSSLGDVTSRHVRLVEDGPFYLRSLCELRDAAGRYGRGVTEWIRPDRVDRAWQRPLVAMRVHRAHNRSMWTPLFMGPRQGRVQRLLNAWRTGA